MFKGCFAGTASSPTAFDFVGDVTAGIPFLFEKEAWRRPYVDLMTLSMSSRTPAVDAAKANAWRLIE